MILHCRCGEEHEVDESFTADEDLREARLAAAEAWSREHRGSGHGLYFNVPGVASGGRPEMLGPSVPRNPHSSPRKDS